MHMPRSRALLAAPSLLCAQVVWRGTTKVGMATSPDGCFLVANYWPPGNCQGRFQQNVLTACTGAEALRRAEEQRQAEAQKQRDAPLFLVKTRVREWTPALERKFEFDFEQN